MERNLLQNPAWQEQDLGTPLSRHPSKYASAVAIPTWNQVKQYEEGDPKVHQALQAGYPRYRLSNQVQELFTHYSAEQAGEGKTLFAFPSFSVASEAATFVYQQTGILPEIKETDQTGIFAVIVPQIFGGVLKSFWTHTGNIISARQAEDILLGNSGDLALESKQILKERIAEIQNTNAESIHLFPTGMAAIFEAYKLIAKPGKSVVQLGLPFVDTLRIEEKWGKHELLPFLSEEDILRRLKLLLESQAENISGVFTEFPSNPLLKSLPLEAISALLKKHKIPFIIDDSVGFGNSQLLPYADMVATSLTKFFSGHGDVMGGALTISLDSEFAEKWQEKLKKKEDLLYGADARALEENSRDFQARRLEINQTTFTLVESLLSSAEIFYPRIVDRDLHEQTLKKDGGHGGLFSLVLPNETTSQIFFDALRVSKGPGFGIGITTAVPQKKITLYGQAELAQAHGLDPNIIRVSVGHEDPQDLIERFQYAFKSLEQRT